MSTFWRVVFGIVVAGLLMSLCCMATIVPVGMIGWLNPQFPQLKVSLGDVPPVATAMEEGFEKPCCTTSEPRTPMPPTTVTDDEWIGDKMGPEKGFPDSSAGPAIAEIYDQNTQLCALVKINDNEVLDWRGSGAYWESLAGQAVIDARFGEHHAKEYLQKYPHCGVYYSVKEFLAANPTMTQP